MRLNVILPAGVSSAVGTVTGLPNSVNVFPAMPLTLRAGTQDVVFSISPHSPVGSYPITFQATAGSQSVSRDAKLSLTAEPPVSPAGPPLILALTPSGSADFLLYCVATSGGPCSLDISVNGLPAGVSITPGTKFRIDQNGTDVALFATPSVATGDYIVEFDGAGTGPGSSLPIDVQIAFPGFTLMGPLKSQYAMGFGSSLQIPIGNRANVIAGQVATYNIAFNISGLPAGVTAEFSPQVVSPGESTTLTLTCAANAALTRNSRVHVTATPTAGTAAMTASFELDLVPPGALPTSRADFARTDGNIVSAVYDPMHQIVFAANRLGNRIEIYSPDAKRIVNSIPIPAPFGMELSVDGKRVIVGTGTSEVFWIDTSTRQIVRRATFHPNRPVQGLQAAHPHELSNGEVLMHYLGTGNGLELWGPDTGSSKVILLPVGSVGLSVRSGDGTKVLISSGDSAPSSYVFDAASGKITASHAGGFGPVAADASGSHFLIGSGLYDGSLNLIKSIDTANLISSVSGNLFSADGQTAYVVAQTTSGSGIFSSSTSASPSQINIAPALLVAGALGVPYAVDSTGLIFSGSDRGLVIEDASFYSNSPEAGFTGNISPNVGPAATATAVSVSGGYDLLPDVYLGGQLVPATQDVAGVHFTTPPLLSGSADLKMFYANGAIGFAPEAFSFGPSIRFLDGNAGDSAGGSTLKITGLGIPADSSQIQVSVGGKTALITANDRYLPGLGFSGPAYPFPERELTVTVPAGQVGASDVAISTPSGDAVSSKGFHYGVTANYPTGDQLNGILYDRFRERLYLGAGDHIDVFSLASKSFLSSIVPPALGSQRALSGLFALTPDGTDLLALNSGDNSLAIINLNDASSSKAISLGCSNNPTGVAATNDGRALITATTASCPPPTAPMGIVSIQLSNNQRTLPSGPAECMGGVIQASNDGTKIAFNGSQPSFPQFCLLDVASGAYSFANDNSNASFDISGDASTFASGPYLLDSQMNAVGYYQFPDYEAPSPQLGFERLNDSGSLLYAPYSRFIDVFDINAGRLRQRVMLGADYSSAKAMAVDTTGQNAFLIANQTLTTVQLDQVPLSVGHVSPNSASAGTKLLIRGTGFKSGDKTQLNGTEVSNTFVDSQTLSLVVPPNLVGPVTLTLTGPDGDTYSLQSAFTVH